ncbi:ubiquinol-cytochrome-c reductase complex assembly factor 1 [Anabrus simplex]|uniref:ubiquinol-cytochrome-c reductase complex assembly factor 1 n=1 Tax=Anabrus simplex TaxID=316456 RepID=UPI0035A304B2
MSRLGIIPLSMLRCYTPCSAISRKELNGYKFMVWRCQSILRTPQCCSVNHLMSIQRCISSATPFRKSQSTRIIAVQPKEGVLKRVIKKIGWLDYSRSKLKRSSYYLYESVADQVNYGKFFHEFRLEDTFFSWFLVTELHVWMLLVRVMAEGEEGRFVRNGVVGAMWEDVSTRTKKLGAANLTSVKTQLTELSQQFQAAIIGYDEGLLSDDKVLAGAIWRRFFQQKCDHPEDIECLVKYIRRQVKLLDELPRDKILVSPDITWAELEPIESSMNG